MPVPPCALRDVRWVRTRARAALQVRRGGKGRMTTEAVLSDPGPRSALPALWVPQLQLHMLAAGTESALLVSRCALPLARAARTSSLLQGK